MTAQEVIKQFMAALDVQNYSDAESALDDAIRKSSRFNGIQDALDSFIAAKKAVELDSIKTILGNYYKEEYEGKQLSELIEMAKTDSTLRTYLNARAIYSETYGSQTFTAIQRIGMLTAETFLQDYCGIILNMNYGYNSSGALNTFGSTGNIDTGAITGSDAGGDTVKDSNTVVPEIGNKFTANSDAPQSISTGNNDWIIVATDYDDTIISGGADSVDAGKGADVIRVTGNYATIKTGAGDNYADSVTVSSEVANVTISDLEEFDSVTIEGTFSVGSATLSSDTVTITDSTGNRTLTISGWSTAKDAAVSVNNSKEKFGAWLQSFIDYEEAATTNTALTSSETSTPITVNLSEVSVVSGDIEGGTISSEFPNISSFTTHGLTVELWGTATNSEATRVTALTADKLSTAQKTVFAGIYKWWIKEGLKLIEDSFNLGVDGAKIKVFFYSENSSTLAFVRQRDSELQLGINMTRFSALNANDVNGASTYNRVTLNLDRTLAHELTHAVMISTVDGYNSLPQFVNEGLAELVHGIDDERGNRIWELAGGSSDATRLTTALDLDNTSTGSNDAYAGGYMFFRYLAKQAAEQTADSIALGDATINVSLSGNNETYYANFNSTLESASTVETEYSVGTAFNHNYTVAAGITQHIYTTDNGAWRFTDLGANNSLTSGNGNDTVTISANDKNLYVNVGGGANTVSLMSSSGNTIVGGSGVDSVRVEYATNNTIQTGAGNDIIEFTNSNPPSTQNYIDAGAGEDQITIYGESNTALGGADSDLIYVRGNYTSADGGTGDDEIQIFATNNTVSGGAGDDNIFIYSTNNSVDGGAGKDQIQIYATDNTVKGGAGSDGFIMYGGVRNLHITDFSLADEDYLYLKYSVDSALYSSQEKAIILGDLSLYLDNLQNISDFFNMDIYLNDGATATTLKNLLHADPFNWASGIYYFLVDNGVVNISSGELVYSSRQAGQNYAKVTIYSNIIEFESDVAATIQIAAPNANNRTVKVNGTDAYTFSGDVQIYNTPNTTLTSSAYTGDYIISNRGTLYVTDSDSVKTVSYTGAADNSTVKVSVGDSKAIYLNANDSVAVTTGTETDYYLADSSSVLKKVGSAVLDSFGDKLSEDIYTYRGGSFTLGANVLDVDFSNELNHYKEDYQSNTMTLWSGALDLAGHNFTLVTDSSDSGITFTYDSNRANIVGISAANFTEGESVIIDGETYTVTNGKIIRSADNEYYNGNWDEFLSNMGENYYWGAITGWTVSGGSAIYFLNDEQAIKISGLNLSGVEVVDGQIAQITLKDKTVTIAEDLIRGNQITVDGAGYNFDFTNAANIEVISAVTSISGSAYGDTVYAEDIEHKNDNFAVNGNAGADLIFVRNVKQSGGNFDISGNEDNDTIGVGSVTVLSGSTFNVNGNEGADSISVDGVTIEGDGNYAVNGNEGNDFISAVNLQNTTGYIGILGNEGNDTISASSINAASGSSYFISGDAYAATSNRDSNDLITVGNVTVSGGGVSVIGNAGNDTITVSNVSVENGTFAVEGDYSAGSLSGNDLITVTNSTGVKIVTGGGNDTLIFGGEVQGTISDFSFNDTIQLNSSVKSGSFRNGILRFGNVRLNLSGVDDITTYASTRVINGETRTTLGEMIADGLTWEVDNGTAIYSEDIITVTGLSSLATADDLDYDNDVTVSIAQNALAQGNTVEITRGFYLALADDVTKPVTQDAAWTVTNGTAKYNQTTTAGFTVSSNTIVYQAAMVGADIITVNNLSTAATDSDLTVSNTTVLISLNALDKNKVVSTPDGYYLALAEDVPVPTTQDAAWTVTNGTAKYRVTTTDGYRVINNQISYQAEIIGNDIITVSNLSTAATDSDLAVSNTTVTVSENALAQNRTVTISDGYTLALASDVTKPETLAAVWNVSSGTAKYNATTTEGYILKDNTIVFQNEITGADIITISGLNNSATVSDITLSGTTVTIAAHALSQSNTVKITDGYTLALASDVTTPVTKPAVWSLDSDNATVTAHYNQTTTAGYVISDNQIVYQEQFVGEDIITISGLSTATRLENIQLNNTTVTVYATALSQSNTVTITEGYTLALGANVTRPVTQAATWNVSSGTAKYNVTTTAGYTITDNTIVYQDEITGADLITVTGLNSTATADDISLDGTTVTISENALAQGNTVEISEGYTLALASDVTTPVTSAAKWTVSGGSARYNTTSTAGYVVSNNTIVYQPERTNASIIAITGLSSAATTSDISFRNTTVTISANALAQNNTVRISNGYNLALARNVTQPTTSKPAWSVSNGSASYNTTTSAGYVVSNNTIIYQNAIANDDIITITGLSSAAATSDISLSRSTVTISANALAQGNTVKINDGYTLALGRNVTTPKVTAEGWIVSGGTGLYQTEWHSGGYILSDNQIVYSAATAPETLITITGLKSTANPKNISLDTSTKTISLTASIVDKKNVSVTDGYALNFGAGTYTGATVTGGSGADTISAAGNSLVINASAGNDSITLANGTSKNSIIGGAGNDTITATRGKNVYLYEDGDGNDIINGWTENDTLKITRGSIESWSVSGGDLTFKVGNGSITIKDGVDKKINIVDSANKLTTEIFEPGFTYDAKKTSITLDEGFTGSINSGTYSTSVITIDGSAAGAVSIGGNSKNNVIIGGAGNDTLNGGTNKNDTLTGGGGADIFIFGRNEGKDVITDYSEEDKISVTSGEISEVSVSSSKKSPDVTFKNGTGTLTVKDGAGKKITTIDSLGAEITQIYEKGAIYNEDKTAVTFTSAFKGTLDSGIVTANGSNISVAQRITGNDLDNVIYGGTKADQLNGGAGNDTLYGGKGADLFIYTAGDDVIADYEAGERISLDGAINGVSVDSDNVIFTTDNGSITVLDGAGVKITTVSKVGTRRKTETFIYESGLTYNEKQSAVTLDADFTGSYTPAETLKNLATIDGTAATNSVSISGTAKANKIYGGRGNDTIYGGGKGNDTLYGGNGADVFIYGNSDGRDVIADYSAEDTIYINTGSISSAAISGSDVTFKVGSGTLKVLNGVGQKITVRDSLGAATTQIYEKGAVYNADKNAVTLTSAMTTTLESGVVTADGSAVTGALKIAGNALNNSIYGGNGADSILGNAGNDYLSGGKGNDTLIGGSGNDTLTGGDGKDVFVFDGGNDLITDYAAGDKIKFDGAFEVSYSGNDVIFETENGSIRVADGVGKEITTMIGTKTTKQIYSGVSARTAELFADDNFIADTQLSEITESKYEVTEIQPQSETFAQEKPLLTFAKK